MKMTGSFSGEGRNLPSCRDLAYHEVSEPTAELAAKPRDDTAQRQISAMS